MKVVIVGVGGIGLELVQDLTRRDGNEITLVDADERRCEELASQVDALVLHGDGTNPEILRKARVGEADALVATTGADALNTVIAMLGRDMGVETIVVKLDGIGLRAACQALGVTEIIAPTIAAAARIVSVLYGMQGFDLSLLARGGLQLVELPVANLAGEKLKQDGLPSDGLAIAVLRGDRVLLAREGTRIEEGDRLLVLAEGAEAANRMRKALGAEKDEGTSRG